MPHWKCSLDCRDCLLGGNRLFGHSSSVGLDRSIEVIAVVIDFDFIRVGLDLDKKSREFGEF